MTDATLRELERRFRSSASMEDEVVWLRARVKAGELSQERLELAACLGHQASEAACGRRRDVAALVDLLRRVGPCALVRSALVLFRGLRGPSPAVTLQFLQEAGGVEPLPSLSELAQQHDERLTAHQLAIHSLEDWAICPCPRHAEAIAAHPPHGWPSEPGNEPGAWADHHLTFTVGDLLGRYVERVGSEVVPWALGYSDPVRARVEAREDGVGH